MVRAAGDSVPFLKKHVRPAARPDAGRLRQLLAALDSDDFKARARAEAEVKGLGELALAELEEAAKHKNTLEKQRRLEALLRKAHRAALPFGTAERVCQWRAVEVLERAATPEARQLLRDLAGGAPASRLTEAARAALTRLEEPARPGRGTSSEGK
jgi:hypothetical protein